MPLRKGAAAAPLVFLIAGEPSGDILGARLMDALRTESGGRIRFAGIGGPMMIRRGFESLFPMRDLAIMGLAEVVGHIPKILRRIGETVAHIRTLDPDVVVTIDSPGFTLRVARKLAPDGPPVVHDVAPTVWAWRPGRARKMAGYLDHVITLLPFEPPYFERHGLGADCVGYPAIEDAVGGDGAGFRRRHGIAPEAPVLCAMPGSRRSEILRLMPVFRATVARLAGEIPGLAVVMPTVPNVADMVDAAIADWPVPVAVVHDPEARKHAFDAANVALVKSGTASVELAAAGVPLVVTQKLNYCSALLFLLLVRIKYVSIVNIMLDREVQPELLQLHCTPAKLARAVKRLFDDEAARADQIEAGRGIARELGMGGPGPSLLAARIVLGRIAAHAGVQASQED